MAKVKTLKHCPLFKSLGFRDLAVLAHHVQEGASKAGEWVTKEGEPSNGLYILQTGKFEIVSTQPSKSSVDLIPGEFFGELSISNGSHLREVAVQCKEAGSYLRLSAAHFHTLQEKYPDVAGKVAQGILSSVTEKMTVTMGLLKSLVHE